MTRWVACLLALPLLLWSSAALAIDTPTIEGEKLHPDVEGVVASRDDCLRNRSITWNVAGVTAGGNVGLWGSESSVCATGMERDSDGGCTEISSPVSVGSGNSTQVTLRVQDIANVIRPEGSSDTCPITSANTEQTVTIYFLQDLNGSEDVAQFAEVQVVLDFAGPSAPTGVTAGVRDHTALVVKWTVPAGETPNGSTILCHRDDETGTGSGSSGGGGVNAGGSTNRSGGLGGGGMAGAGGGIGGMGGAIGGAGGMMGGAGGMMGGAGGMAGAGGMGGMAGGTTSAGGSPTGSGGATSGSGGSPVSQDCTSTIFDLGEIPSDEIVETYRCGSTTGATAEGDAEDLIEDQRYVVAVFSIDVLDNRGALSTLACGTPERVADLPSQFPEGDFSGCGGCEIGAQQHRGTMALFFGLCLMLGFGFRRERRA